MSRNYWTLGKEGMKTRLSKAQAAYENAVENVSDLHMSRSVMVTTNWGQSHPYRLSL